jgi:pimeloyl-ACP methyl ester carboxylesterase
LEELQMIDPKTNQGSLWRCIGMVLCACLVAAPAWSYSPAGPVPEDLKGPETKLWTMDDVNAVVDVSYVTIDGYEKVSQYGAPKACDKVSFLRFRNKHADGNPEHADADLLMVPGILEGANGFDFIGRQLVYLAATEYGKNIEVWAMDRRANCLEDLTGMHAAMSAATVNQAEDTLIGYYYDHQPIDGKTFAGFLPSKDLPFLYYFGMRQTTQDMFAIIQHMVPDADVRKKKVFVGGHSLGGLHTSAFLSWNLSGDASNLADAGYNWCAGAFGFDTDVGPLQSMSTAQISRMTEVSPQIMFPPPPSENAYVKALNAIQKGTLPRDVFIPGVFGPEVIALPQAEGLIADLAPDAKSTVLTKIPHSPELNGVLKILHSRNLYNANHPPSIEDFNYTNQAFVGLVFDDNFSTLSFLQAGLGFLHGGPVVKKQRVLEALAATPGLGPVIQSLLGSQTHYIAADAGPDLQHLGQGPLYTWARRDQIGTTSDPDYTDTTGRVRFTYLQKETTDIRDFTRALYEGPTNLTEWYFPMRLVLDSAAVAGSYATKYGMDVDYPDGPTKVPSLLIESEQGRPAITWAIRRPSRSSNWWSRPASIIWTRCSRR